MPLPVHPTRRNALPRSSAAAGCARAVGIDVVRVADVTHSVETFGRRYLERVYTSSEIADCARSHVAEMARHLASRFAAKEATAKALRSGDEPLNWRHIEVKRHPDGSCDILLRGAVEALARRRGNPVLSVSMSQDGDYATAVVVSDLRHGPPPQGRIPRTHPTGAYER